MTDPVVAAQAAQAEREWQRRHDPILAEEDRVATAARHAAEEAKVAQLCRLGQLRREEEERAAAREATYQRRLQDHREALQRGEPGICLCCGGRLSFLR